MSHPKINNILFLDIETVPLKYKFNELNDIERSLWEKKWSYNPENNAEELYSKAGVYAEFSKVICIGLGYYHEDKFRVKALSHENEKILLEEFCKIVKTYFNKSEHFFCAHNGKEFDFPFLSRRMIVNGVSFPKNFQLQGKKPWEIKHLDTMEMWRFGDYKNFTSLNMLAHIFNIPSPKDEIDGSMVAKVYYEDNDLEKIKKYCLKDVITLARVYQKYNNEKIFSDEEIEFA